MDGNSQCFPMLGNQMHSFVVVSPLVWYKIYEKSLCLLHAHYFQTERLNKHCGIPCLVRSALSSQTCVLNCGLCGTTRYSRCPISEILSTSNFTESLRPTSNPEKWTAAGRASKKRVLPSRQCISEKLEEVLSGACKGAQICFQSVAAITYSVNYGDQYIFAH